MWHYFSLLGDSQYNKIILHQWFPINTSRPSSVSVEWGYNVSSRSFIDNLSFQNHGVDSPSSNLMAFTFPPLNLTSQHVELYVVHLHNNLSSNSFRYWKNAIFPLWSHNWLQSSTSWIMSCSVSEVTLAKQNTQHLLSRQIIIKSKVRTCSFIPHIQVHQSRSY